jgi:MFS family permease
VPLYLELALGLSASAAGMVLISFMLGATIGSMITGRLFSQIRHYKRIPLTGLAVSIAALAVVAIDPAGWPMPAVALLLALAGGGLGTMYPVTTVLIQNVVLPHQFGTATGTLNFFRLLGGAIIVAVFGAIVLGTLGNAGGVSAIDSIGGGATRSAADFGFVFRLVFIAADCFLLVAFVAMSMVEERPLRGPPELGPPPAAVPA